MGLFIPLVATELTLYSRAMVLVVHRREGVSD